MDTTAADETRQPADADLVQRCLGGDPEAFQALAARYYRPVAGFLFKRVRRTDVVEDLAQDTFLEALRSLQAGRRPEHFSSWLFGIAHNCSGKWLRRKRPLLFAPDDPPGRTAVAPPSLLEEQEEQRRRLSALEAGLAELPEETRRLLEAKHHQGKTCEQIAAETGRPVGTVKSLLSRAYKALRARLTPAGEDDP
jgi:RNA polymerase sigma-70 factor (ECF subfamily)